MSRFESEQFLLCVMGIDSIPEITIKEGEVLQVSDDGGDKVRLVERPDGGWYPVAHFTEHDPIFEEGEKVIALTDDGVVPGRAYTVVGYDDDHDIEIEEKEGYFNACYFISADGPTRQWAEKKARVGKFRHHEKVLCNHDYGREGSIDYCRKGQEYTIVGQDNERSEPQVRLAERENGGWYPAAWFDKIETKTETEESGDSADITRAINVTSP